MLTLNRLKARLLVKLNRMKLHRRRVNQQ